MTASFTTTKPQIERDRWGRPLVYPPQGGKAIAYTRCTTYVGSIEDPHNLAKWKERHVVMGMARRPELVDTAQGTPPEDKGTLNSLAEDAKEAAGANDAARIGTYLHGLTEAVDRGEDPGQVPFPDLAIPRDPSDFIADVAAYQVATQALRAVSIEQFSVLDPRKIGGTPDRVVEYQGKRYIADLKTGSVDWGWLKIAAQLAVYARSTPYDITTGRRMPAHGADVTKGIVVHLPAGSGTCQLYWVDLLAGWDAVRVCGQVREQRQRKRAEVLAPFDDVPAEPVQPGEVLVGTPGASPAPDLAAVLKLTRTRDEALALWAANRDVWTDNLTDLAKAHIAALAQ